MRANYTQVMITSEELYFGGNIVKQNEDSNYMDLHCVTDLGQQSEDK